MYGTLGGDVLGLIPADVAVRADDALVDGLVRLLIDMRQEARQTRDWARADTIRDHLAGLGVVLEDGAEGTRWRLSRQD